jgi:formamidopyrimidine-DNA glycosylase
MVEAPRIYEFWIKIHKLLGKIIRVSGVQKDKFDLINKSIIEWIFAGKNLLFKLDNSKFIVAHFGMYGKSTVNSLHPKYKIYLQKGIVKRPSIEIELDNKNIFRFYTTSLKEINQEMFDNIDFNFRSKLDISHPKYDEEILLNHWKRKRDENPNMFSSDFLLNQTIGVGIGNILQLEGLYYAKIHPLCKVKNLEKEDFKNIISGIQKTIDKIFMKTNSHDFLIYHKAYCPLNHKTNTKYVGIYNRRMNFCNECQKCNDDIPDMNKLKNKK